MSSRPGLLQQIVLTVVGAVLVIIGILTANPALIALGQTLVASAFISFAAGYVFKPKEPGTLESNSPTYAFLGAENPTHGDTSIAVVYANDEASTKPGHMVSPTYMQAYTTPKGFEDTDFTRAKSTDGQSLSVLMAVAEGPIVGIEDIRINGEPVYEIHTDETIGKGNGTTKTFVVEGRGIEIRTMEITSGGTQKSWLRIERNELVCTGDGSRILWTVKLTDPGVEIDDQHELKWYLGPAAIASALLTDSSDVRPIAWMDEGRTTLYINTQVPIAVGTRLWVGLIQRYQKDLLISRADDGKSVRVAFNTAPAAGVRIAGTWKRRAISGLRCELRYGCAHQLPISGFDMIQNTVSKNASMAFNDYATYPTDEPVDDVRVTFASGAGGFTAIDPKNGSRNAVFAQIQMEWKLTSEADSAYRQLRDPAGAVTGKRLNEFKLSADSTELVLWEFSIRRILERWVAEHPGDNTAASELALWQRSKVTIRIKRTNRVQHDTNTYISDEIVWASSTKVINEKVNHPGIALIGIHAIASSRLNGALPRITCRARGARNVYAYADGAWTASSTAQANPVWAAIDLITNSRYGAGAQYTIADNIDLASAVDAASWCDEMVTRNGVTEKRAVIDYVCDLRRQLMEHVRDMLLPARVVPVQRGNVWVFVVDRPEADTGAYVITDDGSGGRTLKDSLAFVHQPITTQITEMQVSYLDRDDDWQRAEVWVAPQVPASNRRIQRATAFGITRGSQATEYANFLYAKQVAQGCMVSWSMMPSGMPIEAGDVLRVRSTRLGIDMYVRIMRWTLESADELAVSVEAAQYVPSVYGQSFESQTVIRRSADKSKKLSLSATTSTSRDGSGVTQSAAKIAATVRRAA